MREDDHPLWVRDAFLGRGQPYPCGTVVFRGHTIARDIEVRSWRVGIDLGAYRSGRLCAAEVRDGRIRFHLATAPPGTDALPRTPKRSLPMRAWFVFAHLSPLRESGPLQVLVLLTGLPALYYAAALGTDGLDLPIALAALGAVGIALWAPGLLFLAAVAGDVAAELGPGALLPAIPLFGAGLACHST